MTVKNIDQRVLIVIPAFNEEKNIGNVVADTRLKVPSADIVVIDDGSTDNTVMRALSAGAKVISLPINIGIGGAMQTGFKYAYERGYTVAVQIDGDGQHDPSEVDKLINPIFKGTSDIVKGSRYLEDTGYQTPIFRRIGMILFARITSFVLRQKITDTTSGFWAVNRKVLKVLSSNYPTDFPDADSLIYLGLLGFRISEAPVHMRERFSGASTITFFKSLYYPFKLLLSIFTILLHNFIEGGRINK
jgi:glycosyltransferase involved in cell wall biosynthesis